MASRTSSTSNTSPFRAAISGSHMPALDGLRAVAAFSVITLHCGYPSWFDGVTAFFVLSGFLITSLLIREFEATGTVSLKAFYARRTLRIFPAYYVCVIASFTIDSIAGNRWPDGLLRSALGYVVNYFNALIVEPDFSSIGHLWSLGVEEQFYLLWPALFLLLATAGLRTVRVVLVAIVVGSIAWRITLHYVFGFGIAYLYNAFDARFDNLAIGCLLATMVWTPMAEQMVRRVAPTVWAPLLTYAVSLAILQGLPMLQKHLFGYTVYSLLMAVLLVQLLELNRTAMWHWLDSRVAVFLGTISYPIYLYHKWGINLAQWIPSAPKIVVLLAGTLFTVIGAIGSYYIVERPFLELKKRFVPGRRPERLRVDSVAIPGMRVG